MKFILSCFFCLLACAILKGQTGFEVFASVGYQFPLAPSKLNPLVESNMFRVNPIGPNATAIGSYSSGYIGKIGIGYTLKNGIEPGIVISYQTMHNLKVSYQDIGSASNQSFNGNSFAITPVIRIKALHEKYFTPYILLGVPVNLTETSIEMEGWTSSSGNYFYNQYYPRQLAVGVLGGVGIGYQIKNAWHIYADLTATGISFTPKKGFFTTGGNSTPATTEERTLNTKEEREKYGRSVIMPMGHWGINIGVQCTFN